MTLFKYLSSTNRRKRGKQLSPREIIESDENTGTITVLGKAGRKTWVAFEDAKSAQMSHDVTDMIQDALNHLVSNIDETLSY